MLRRVLPLVLCAAALLACEKIDKVLEGPQPVVSKLSIGVSSPLNLSQGGVQTLTATMTRVGAFTGEPTLTVEGLPEGVTATVGAFSLASESTTASLSIRATADAKLGTYLLTVRLRGNGSSDATTPLVLNVLEVPGISVTSSKSSLVVTRGGVAPFVVNVARTNFTAPVSVTLQAPTGISLALDGNPFSGDRAQATLAIAPEVAPGTYEVTLRASGAGVPEKTLPLNVSVTSDAFQVLAASDVDAPQASVATTNLVINRASYAGAVMLFVEGLPAGASATIDPQTTSAATATLTLVTGATVPVGSYNFSLRGRGAGVSDVVTPMSLTVRPAQFSVSAAPQAVTLTQGSNTVSTITLARAGFDGVLNLSTSGAPAGVTVAAQPAVVTGTSATLTITAASNAPGGTYDIAVRAAPTGLPSSAAPVAIVSVTVKPLAVGAGNVILDWSGCAIPSWLASQDGQGAWTQQLPSGGKFQFTIAGARGGVAYVEGAVTTVRFMTLPELSAGALDMCAPPLPQKTAVGSTIHSTSATELYSYALGGGTTTSSAALPNWTISGVRDGPQDFIAWGTSSFSLTLRGLIRRDVNLPNGGSLGLLNMDGSESFPLSRVNLNFVATGGGAETYNHTMSYLTTPSCIVNPLATTTTVSTSTSMNGIPDALQRATDYHEITVRGITATRTRTATLAFHTLAPQTVALPAVIAAPTITLLPGGYKRVQASFGVLAAEYNGMTTLSYNDGSRVMTVTSTKGYSGTGTYIVAMPDFTGVTGWSNAFAIPATTAVSWSYTLEGASHASPCTEGRRSVTLRQTGGI